MRPLGVLPVDLPCRKPLEHLVERHPSFQARQRGAQAEVDAVAERQVVVDLAGDVEAVGVGKATLVAVR